MTSAKRKSESEQNLWNTDVRGTSEAIGDVMLEPSEPLTNRTRKSYEMPRG